MKKTLSVIFALLLTVLLAFTAGCKPSAVPDSSGGGASDGWQGNWEKPDVPDTPDEPVKHTCENACYICGKCLTDCKDEACAEKCHEPRDRTKYVFNGTDKKVEKKGGVTIDGDHLGNINANPSAEVIYHVVAEKATVACLGATICEMFEDRYFTANTPLYVNGEQYYSRGYLKGGPTVWTDFYTVYLGCVNLKEGVNEIRFTGLADAYNFKDFTFLSDAKLSLSAAVEEHVCNHKNAAGKCTDYTCNADECLDKEESGWTVSEFGAGDERILKYGKKHGKEVSLWIAAENCIGNMANGSITGFSEQTVVTSFEVTEDTYVRISLSTSTSMSMGSPFTDMYTFTFNGEEVKTGAKVGIVENGGWGRYVESRLIYLKAKKGLNSFVLVHNSSNMGDNINKIIFAVEKGELKLSAAAKPGETVAVESVALAVEGGVETLKKGETVKCDVTVLPVSALSGLTVTYASDNTDVIEVGNDGTATAKKAGKATVNVTIGGLLRKINLFVVNGDGTAYEAENAVLTNASVESNGKYVGGINNAGAKVNFTVDGGAGGKVFLRIYTSVVDPGKTSVNDYFTIKVNDTDIDLTAGQFAYVGTGAGWNTDTGYFTVEITLGEGSNTIELISAGTSVQTTLDKIVIY